MDLRNVYMGKILRVDLNEGSCEEEELTEEMVENHIGGAALGIELYKQHADREPVVIGTGPLTGTFAPSSSGGFVTARSPVTGRVCHVPLMGQTAVELKYSGFDFVVILGEAAKPVRLWLHDELAEVADAGPIWGLDVWKTTDWLRHEHGDDYVQVLSIGPAGEARSPLAQFSENHWGSRDIFGLGAALGARKLKAVAMRGMGSLDVADGFFEACRKTQVEIRKGRIYGRKGLLPLLEALGAKAQELEPLQRQAHRSLALFNSPYAACTYLMIEEPAELLKESKKDEPGLLLTDPAGVLSLLALGDGLPAVLRRINRLGLDPVACGNLLRKENLTGAADAEKRLQEIAATVSGLEAAGVANVYGAAPWPLTNAPEERLVQALAVFSHALPPRPVGGGYDDFSVSGDPVARASWWVERMAACSILGLCPLSALLSPVFSMEETAGWCRDAAGWEGFTAEKLRAKCRDLVRETVALGGPKGTVPADWVTPGWEEDLKKLSTA